MLSENERLRLHTQAVMGRGSEPKRLDPRRTRHKFGDINAANARAACALATRYWQPPEDGEAVEVRGYRPPLDAKATIAWRDIARLLGFHSVASVKQSALRVLLAATTPGYITEVADPEDEENFYATIRFDTGHTWTCHPRGLGTKTFSYDMTWETPTTTQGENNGDLTEAQIRKPNHHNNRHEQRTQ